MRLWVSLVLLLPLAGQTPAFEVASLRPATSSRNSSGVCYGLKAGENLQVTGVSIAGMVIDAYEGEADRFDLPNWAESRFDVAAKMPERTNVAGCKLMLRNLLAERFHMVTAVEPRQMPSYFLKVAKSGLELKAVDGPPSDPRAAATSKSENGRTRASFHGAPWSRVFIAVQTAVVLGARRGVLDSDFVGDETGLTGYYDGEIEYEFPSTENADVTLPHAPSLQDALAGQAGLVLELRKAPRKVLVIRSSDRTPTDN